MIIIGLGANLPSCHGAPEQTLQKAIDAMRHKGLNVVSASSVWRSAPVPISDQPWYCNAVCVVDTPLDVHSIWEILSQIEQEFGRVRTEKNAARVLDLDLLIHHDTVMHGDTLTLPHPRLHERAFVLHPLHEVWPNWRHPSMDKYVDEFITLLPSDQKIKRCEDTQLLSTGRE